MELSSDGNAKGKKRKLVIEKATGPAWGAHSYAANKNHAINKSMMDSGKDPGFGDFGRYFSEKKRKLREQYHQDAGASVLGEISAGTADPKSIVETESSVGGEKKKLLFEGVSIFVDGFTTPTHQELRFLMMSHGGVFENYFSSQRVTHIICSTLPDSKIMNPRLMSRGLPIVKPEWIVDSITENRLLPWGGYQLERIAYSHPHQKTLAASFSARKVDSTFIRCTTAPEKDAQNALDVGKTNLVNLKNEVEPPPSDSLEDAGQRVMTETIQRIPKVEANIELPVLPLSPADTLHKWIDPELASESDDHIQPNGNLPNAAVVQKPVKKPTAGRGHSTLDDPDFVQSYFKSSRLHFIGTWRTRYQNLVNAGSFGNPDQGMSALPVAGSTARPVIIHLDMDCFFVSVVVRNQPGLIGKPVAVCHSNSAQGTGEISSANYPARSYGIRAGMFVRDAKARCPELTIVPYDFPAYEQVADTVYSILHRHCSVVQAVSCDEAFLDVTGHPEPANLASTIREEIFQATQCTASAGIAENLLLARVATKKAKPNGQYVIQPHEVKEFMVTLPVEELPGVGWTLREKLHGNGLYNCADLQSLSKDALQQAYGAKTGVMLWSYAQGIDQREVQPAQERKSIGAEVNWGVRFSCNDDAQQFLVDLSNEVASRMQKSSASGRTITLKVKKRKEGVGEPTKFMGCGVCDNISRSETVGYPTNSAEVLLRVGRQLFASLHLDVQEVRGVGLQVSRLVSTNTGIRKQHNGLDSWLAASTKLGKGKELMRPIPEDVQCVPGDLPEDTDLENCAGPSSPWNGTDCEELTQREGGKSDSEPLAILDWKTPDAVQQHGQTVSETKGKESTSLELPPFSQIDPSVLDCLPPEIVAEIIDANKAQEELKNRENSEGQTEALPQNTSGMQRPPDGQRHAKTKKGKTKPKNSFLQLPPQSMLDPSVLESLPEDILAELNQAYGQEFKQKSSRSQLSKPPPNLPQAFSGDAVSQKEKTQVNIRVSSRNSCGSIQSVKQPENINSISESIEENLLDFGQPKSEKETVYYHTMLQNIVESINSGQSSRSLSSSLLALGSCMHIQDGRDSFALQQFANQCFQLLIGYVRAIAARDLEEVHLIILFLKRLGSTSNLWRTVQELTIAAAKDVISELYGGELSID
ncbi:unnamed protein product [Calypogeia fissa]